LPRRAARAKRPTRYGTAFFAERADGAVLLRRRPPNGLLGGMMEVPSGPWSADPAGTPGAPPLAGEWRPHGAAVEHTFTHFHLVLHILRARFPMDTVAPAGGRWVPRRAIAGEALPNLMRKVVAAVLGAEAVRRREAPSAPAGAGDRSA
jgi:A/G-specific adenine glycosylase